MALLARPPYSAAVLPRPNRQLRLIALAPSPKSNFKIAPLSRFVLSSFVLGFRLLAKTAHFIVPIAIMAEVARYFRALPHGIDLASITRNFI
jgi:hypothetical protein